jgi:hypothetical protein
MSKAFRSWDVDQAWLLPPSVHEFAPAGHLAHFVRNTVRKGLDLSAIRSTYDEDRDQPPYHPAMTVGLWLTFRSTGASSFVCSGSASRAWTTRATSIPAT